MRALRLLPLITAAFVAGVVAVVACSDDSPGDADAATCDCPAAEPPLAGRIVSVTGQRSIPANGGDFAEAVCPLGSTILGGGCRMTETGALTLVEAGIDRAGAQSEYLCRFRSADAQSRMVTAEAICLVPAQ